MDVAMHGLLVVVVVSVVIMCLLACLSATREGR